MTQWHGVWIVATTAIAVSVSLYTRRIASLRLVSLRFAVHRATSHLRRGRGSTTIPERKKRGQNRDEILCHSSHGSAVPNPRIDRALAAGPTREKLRDLDQPITADLPSRRNPTRVDIVDELLGPSYVDSACRMSVSQIRQGSDLSEWDGK